MSHDQMHNVSDLSLTLPVTGSGKYGATNTSVILSGGLGFRVPSQAKIDRGQLGLCVCVCVCVCACMCVCVCEKQ